MTQLERYIIRLAPISWTLKQTKRIYPPGFQGVPLYDVIVFFFQQVKKIGFSERAASISFNFLMAIPAGMIFIFTLVPYLKVSNEFIHQLLVTVHDVLQNQKTYELVRTVIYDLFYTPRSGLLSFSFILALYFASNAMMGVMRTFDRSFFQERKTHMFHKRWVAIKLTFLLILLVFCSILLLTTQGAIKKTLLTKLGMNSAFVSGLISYARWLIILMLNFFSIALIYKFAPAVKVRWKTFSPGSILACVLTILTSYLFSLWVNNFGKFNQVYGSISTLLFIMNLVFFNSFILLIGFELNVSITMIKTQSLLRQKKEAEERTGTDME